MIKGLHQNSRGSGDKCPLVWVIQAASSKRVAVCAVDVMWPTKPTTLKHSCPLPHSERRHRAPHSCDLRPGVAATKNRLLPDAPFERRISGVWFWVRQDVFYPEAIDGAGHCGTRCSRRGQHGCRQDGDRSDGGQGWGAAAALPAECAHARRRRASRGRRGWRTNKDMNITSTRLL